MEELAQYGTRIIPSLALKNEIDAYIEKKPLRDEEDKKSCILVVIGVNQNGDKEFLSDRKRDQRKHAELERGIKKFVDTFEDKYPKAVMCLTKDEEELLTFTDFPAAHFQHIRTTNPIESSFSTIRLRTKKRRNCVNRKPTLTMMFKLSQQVEKGWRKLRGFKEILYVLERKQYLNGSRMENVVA